MKKLDDYMAMPYRMEIVEDKDEGGFVVSYPDLPGCITCGETVESAVANALDAKKAWLEAASAPQGRSPPPYRHSFSCEKRRKRRRLCPHHKIRSGYLRPRTRRKGHWGCRTAA